jgi:4'-phosphopantetheinyl transferase
VACAAATSTLATATPEAGDWNLHLGAVHVWTVTLGNSPILIDECLRRISPVEQVQAQGFRRDQDRNRFLRTRAVVRTLLGHYLDVLPREIAFRYQGFGKPSVLAPASGTWLEFNVSHSADVAVLALARSRQVGIDVEQIRELAGFDALAHMVCSPGELSVLSEVPAEARLPAFLRCWTRKEALLKAMGTGFSVSPTEVEVLYDPAVPLGMHGTPAHHARWSLVELSTVPGYIAALAVEGNDYEAICHTLTDWSLLGMRAPAS